MIHLEIKDKYGIITFDRPEALNALNSEVIMRLEEIINQVEEDNSIKALIFTGRGNSFIAGADIKEMEPLRGHEIREFSLKGRNLFRRIEKLPIVSIAVINGYALGGGLEFALACHIRIASEKAKLGFPEASLGVVPGFSGTQRLPRAIGKMDAIRLMATGETINAEEAKELALVSKVYPGQELMEEAEKLASKIVKNSSTAIEGILKAIDIGLDLPKDHAMEIETGLVVSNFGTPDQIEGMRAFSEKRKPEFQ